MAVGSSGAQAKAILAFLPTLQKGSAAWSHSSRLRWVIILLPALSVIVYDTLRELVSPGIPRSWPGSPIMTMVGCIGAVASAYLLFTIFERQKRSLLWLGRELTDLSAVPVGGPAQPDEVLGAYVDRILRTLPIGAAAVYLRNPETGRCGRSAARGALAAALPLEVDLDEPAFAAAVRGSEARWLPNYLRIDQSENALPAVLVPLRSRDETLGVLVLAGDSRSVLQENIELLAVLGCQMAVIVDNYALFQETRLHAEQRQNLAVLQERDRLAREMHDSLAQVLGLIALKSRVVKDLLARGMLAQASKEVAEIELTADAAYTDVREAILGLRGALKTARRLVPNLEDYLTQFSRLNGLDAHLAVAASAPTKFAAAAEAQLIRVIQEALTNVRKHAGAKSVVVRFDAEPGYARIVIEDDGRGFSPQERASPAGQGYGLQTMSERVESLGGFLTLDSEPGRGTRVIVRLPVEAVAAEELDEPSLAAAGCQA